MPFRRVALAPVVAALLLAGCVAGGPPEVEGPSVRGSTSMPPRSVPTPPATPEGEDVPAPGGPGETGPTPAPPNPVPPTPTEPSAEPTPPAPPPPGPTPPASTPPPSGPGSPSAPPSAGALPMLRFEAGEDAAPGRYVASFSLAADGTSFAASLRGVPEARVHADSLFLLRNDDPGRPHEVQVTAAREGGAQGVEEARIRLRDAGGATVAVLDLLAPAPSASFTLPAGARVEGSWTFALGAHPVETFSWTLRMDAQG